MSPIEFVWHFYFPSCVVVVIGFVLSANKAIPFNLSWWRIALRSGRCFINYLNDELIEIINGKCTISWLWAKSFLLRFEVFNVSSAKRHSFQINLTFLLVKLKTGKRSKWAQTSLCLIILIIMQLNMEIFAKNAVMQK